MVRIHFQKRYHMKQPNINEMFHSIQKLKASSFFSSGGSRWHIKHTSEEPLDLKKFNSININMTVCPFNQNQPKHIKYYSISKPNK